MNTKPQIKIEFCTQCRWLLRAAWTAQELLTTFEAELGSVTLIPSTGGVFRVFSGPELLWCRKERGGFPELKELKQIIRDKVAPDKELGHSDKPTEG